MRTRRAGREQAVLPLAGVAVCLGLALLGAACGGMSEEDRLIDRFRSLAALAEEENADGILAAVDEDYADFEGRDKAAIEAMIQGYFESYRGIVLSVLGVRVGELGSEAASLEADVTFSSGAVEALRRLVRVAGQFYRLEVGWVKRGGDWLVASAAWREVGLGELLSESRDAVQELLPSR